MGKAISEGFLKSAEGALSGGSMITGANLRSSLKPKSPKPVETPKASMYCWTDLPESRKEMNSLEFITWLAEECNVIIAPGTGFGPLGEGKVRFALVTPEERIAEATRRIGEALKG